MLRLVSSQNESNELMIKHAQPYQDCLIKINITLNKGKNKACSVFEQKRIVAILGAMMPVSFFWPPVFCSFIGKGIRNFSKSLLVFFFHPTVFSTNLVDSTKNYTIRNEKKHFHVELPLSQKI